MTEEYVKGQFVWPSDRRKAEAKTLAKIAESKKDGYHCDDCGAQPQYCSCNSCDYGDQEM